MSGSTQQSTNVNVCQNFFIGELIPSKSDITLRLRILSMKSNREFKITHSNRKRIICCCVDNSCKWYLRGLFVKSKGVWEIKKYNDQHTCSLDLRFKRDRGASTSHAIAHLVRKDDLKPVKIKESIESKYGVQISYWKAWKAREVIRALDDGSHEDSFVKLPSYFWLLENVNPGTYTKYEVDSRNRFVQCIISFGASISGFRTSIRPVIAVDACHLKGKYRGKLFIAASIDGNGRIFPLAYGVAATESDQTWLWFFQQLKHVIGNVDELVIISDRHPSIEPCARSVFTDMVYGICIYHLGLNMNSKFRVKADDFLYRAAKVYTEKEFEDTMHYVRNTNRRVYDYLIDADPRKWARCYFPSRRYSIMTTNIAESMNALLNDAREKPLIKLFEIIRLKLQTWFHDRRIEADTCNSIMAPKIEKLIEKRDDESRRYTVHGINHSKFYMLDGRHDATVDINERHCTCNVLQLDQLPCSHAVRACRERNVSVYTLCSR